MDKVIKRNVENFVKSYNTNLDKYFDIVIGQEVDRIVLDDDYKKDLITNTKLFQELDKLDKELEEAKAETLGELNAAAEQYKEPFVEMATIRGSDLIKEDVELFKSGIKLTNLELQAMVNKYDRSGNGTMKRLAKSYAEDNSISVEIKERSYHISVIDQLLEYVTNVMNNGIDVSGMFLSKKDNRLELIEDFKSDVL